MRNMTRNLFNLLQKDEFEPIEMLDILLVGQAPSQGIHLTNAGQQITFNGKIYIPFPLTRTDLQETVTSGVDETPDVTMMITNVDQQMAGLLNGALTELATATLWMTDRRLIPSLATRPGNAIRLTTGEVRQIQLTETSLTFRIVNVVGQKQRVTVPKRVWQPGCNYVFGSQACGVTRDAPDQAGHPIKISSTAQAGTTDRYIVLDASVLTAVGSPANPSQYFNGSDIVFIDGPAGLQAQFIQRISVVGGQTRAYMRNSYLKTPNPGDPFILRRWCRKTFADCQLYQGNVFNFGGFPGVPPQIFKPSTGTAPPRLT